MRKLDSKTFEVDEGLDLVVDDCGHPYYAIVSTRDGDPEWTTQAIEKALLREGLKVWCDATSWHHQRDYSTVQLREGGYQENAMRPNASRRHDKSARYEKSNARFAQRLRDKLIELGARATSGGMYEYEIDTTVGPLRLSVHENVSEKGAWVAGRFVDIARALRVIRDVNPYSGKWNHHFFADDNEDAAIDWLTRDIQRILEGAGHQVRGPFYVAQRGHFYGGGKLRPFSTLSDAIEHGQNLGKPFDVHNGAGAVVWSYDMRPNAGYYVWPLDPKTTSPLTTEGPFGPYPLANAKTTARIRATEGKHDYAVTRGGDPERMHVEAIYQHGTGRNLTR